MRLVNRSAIDVEGRGALCVGACEPVFIGEGLGCAGCLKLAARYILRMHASRQCSACAYAAHMYACMRGRGTSHMLVLICTCMSACRV